MSTNTQMNTAQLEVADRSKSHRFWVRFRRNWQLHLMSLIPLIYIIVFHFLPMYGIQIAFRDYSAKKGIWGSAWVGLKHFQRLVGSPKFGELLRNTLSVSVYSLLIDTPCAVLMALLLHVCRKEKLKKLAQNVSYMPHFISVVVLVGILNQVCNPVFGLVGTIWKLLGNSGNAPDVRASASAFTHMYVWSGIWQNLGWSSIIYIAALSGVSPELHEAAQIDGASRFQRVLHVDLPAILPTVAIKMIMNTGHIMSVGYEKAYLMQNDLNLKRSELISTYVYKVGLKQNQMSFSTAVSLLNSVANLIILCSVNWFVKKITDGEHALF